MKIEVLSYYRSIVFFIVGILSVILAVKNRDKKSNKFIIILDVISLLPLIFEILNPVCRINKLFLTAILDFWHMFIGCILYLESLTFCAVKHRKLNEELKNKLSLKVPIIIILMLLVIISNFFLYKEIYTEINLINNSEIILTYHSSGNGGYFDGHNFVYVVNDKYCKEISIDVEDCYRYHTKHFVHKKLKEITNDELQNKGIEVLHHNGHTVIYKNKKIIHEIDCPYSNNELTGIFYE